MNCLLIYESELTSDNTAVISGKRLEYLVERHQIKEGIEISGGVINGKLGKVKVKSFSKDSAEIELHCSLNPPIRKKTSLIIALPRPQAQKRIIQAAATFGISSLYFIRSENVEKSYFQSKMLNSHNVNKNILEGLEQAVDTIPPEIKIFKRFHDYLDFYDSKDSEEESKILFCLTATKENILNHKVNSSKIYAIGPELGWNKYERNEFANRGFEILSLGSRVYKTEQVALLCMQ